MPKQSKSATFRNDLRKIYDLGWKPCVFGAWYLINLGWPVRYNINSEYLKFRMFTYYGEEYLNNKHRKLEWLLSPAKIYELLKYGYWAHNRMNQ